MKRTISLLLACIMVAMTLASCSENKNNSDNKETTPSNQGGNESTPSSETETETEGETKAVANIPEGTKFTGETFTVLTYPEDIFVWGDVDWSATEYTGEGLNDAVYERIQQVEQLLDIDIKTAYSAGQGDTSTLANSVKTSDGAYQLAAVGIGGTFSIASNGTIHELNRYAENGTLDLTSSWWDQNILNDMSIKHMNFALTGDIGTMYKKSIGCLMFNKKILNENTSLEDPYTLMREGKWTIDKVVEMGSEISNDLDGNGVYDQNDQYGLICFCDMMALAAIGADVKFMEKDDTDTPVDSFYSERTVGVVDKLATLMYEPKLTYSWSKNGVGEEPAFKMFQTDKSLFYYGELHAVATMRDMESDFGIMPMPKYDEAQEGYHHCVNPNVAAVYVIPADNTKYELTGYTMDALGAASKNLLTPAYFDKTLQGKVSRDSESQESLDIIISTIRYDIGYLGGFGYGNMLYSMADSYNTDLASTFKKQSKIITKSADRTIKAFDDLAANLASQN